VKLDQLKLVDGKQVHFTDTNFCLVSDGLLVQVASFLCDDWQNILTIPSSFVRQSQQYHSLLARLIRGGIHLAYPLSDKLDCWVTVAEGFLFWVDVASKDFQPFYKIPRGRRPLRRGLCIKDDHVLIGEYWGNPERTAVNIYKVHIPTGNIEIFYQFPAHSVRHIHTVDKDPYSNQLWVSTGDEDPECKIMLLDATTAETTLIGAGSQQWRTVSFAFRPDAVYWGTDNHLGSNEIWRYDRATAEISKIGNVIGPVYYNSCLDDAIVFGTTMEKGEGQQDGYGRLYALDMQNELHEVWKAKKDRWSAHYFGYGVFEFAEGRAGKNKFWVTAKGFEGGLRSILFELKHE